MGKVEKYDKTKKFYIIVPKIHVATQDIIFKSSDRDSKKKKPTTRVEQWSWVFTFGEDICALRLQASLTRFSAICGPAHLPGQVPVPKVELPDITKRPITRIGQ